VPLLAANSDTWANFSPWYLLSVPLLLVIGCILWYGLTLKKGQDKKIIAKKASAEPGDDPFANMYASEGEGMPSPAAAAWNNTQSPEEAMINVRSRHGIGSSQNVELMVAALGYSVGSTPFLPVRTIAVDELGGFSLSAFRDMAQIMRGLEAVVAELDRLDAILSRPLNPAESAYQQKVWAAQSNLFYQLEQYVADLAQRNFVSMDEITPFITQLEDELQWFEDHDGNVKPDFESNPVYLLLRPALDRLIANLEQFEDAMPVLPPANSPP